MIIAVDFDGTLCKEKWPDIGQPNNELISFLTLSQQSGSKVILWTCRNGELLDRAVDWCFEHGLSFDAVNENLPEIIKRYGRDTRKVYADIYIDDKSYNQFLESDFQKMCSRIKAERKPKKLNDLERYIEGNGVL